MPRDVVIKVRLTEVEAGAWKRAADLAGLTVSEWVRRRVVGVAVAVPPPPVAAPAAAPRKRARRR